MAEIKDRIIELRLSKGLTQGELAKELELSPSSIGMYEQGRRKPSFELLEKISDYFNVDMDYLMGRSDVKNKYQLELANKEPQSTSEKIKKLRIDNNLDPEELREKLNQSYNLNIPKNAILKWESGVVRPNNGYLSAYANYFKVDLNYLVDLSKTPAPLDFINPNLAELSNWETYQLQELFNQNVLFFTDKTISDEDKKKFFEALQDVYFEIKMLKQQKLKNKK